MKNLTGKSYRKISQIFNDKYGNHGYDSEVFGKCLIIYKNNKEIVAFRSSAVSNFKIELWINEHIDKKNAAHENTKNIGDTLLTDELQLVLKQMNELESFINKSINLIDLSRDQSQRELHSLEDCYNKFHSLQVLINKFNPKLYLTFHNEKK